MKGSGKPRENFLSGPTNFCLSNSGEKAGREKFSLSIFTILASPPTLITFTPTHLMTFAHKSYHFFFGLFSILICHHSTPGPGSLLLFFFFFSNVIYCFLWSLYSSSIYCFLLIFWFRMTFNFFTL